jgi:DNA-binding HxlR family transcriptional regulator
MTAGNLSSQLSVLESSGYILIEKKFKGKKPLTEIKLTELGNEAFRNYLETLDSMIAALKPHT